VHLRERNLPRIVLLDCDDEVAASLEAEGYDVAFGYTGYFVEHPDMDVPPALHEKDLLIIDLDPGWTPRPQEELWPPDQGTLRPRGKHAREPRYGGEPLSGFASSLHRGGLIICLLEGATSPALATPSTVGVTSGGFRRRCTREPCLDGLRPSR
jgi:hypothetical protein